MIALLLGSKIGRYVVAGVGIALAIGLFVIRVFAAGRKSALVDGMERQLNNVKARQNAENTLRVAPDAERQRMRDKWTRP